MRIASCHVANPNYELTSRFISEVLKRVSGSENSWPKTWRVLNWAFIWSTETLMIT